MIINGIVERKLILLEETLLEIQSWKIVKYTSFKNSSLEKSAVERALTVCVEIMIDVASRIIALHEIPPKTESLGKLEQIAKLKAIADSKKYQDMIKFRNFIVHRYEKIDPEILFDVITNKLNLYRDFINEIRLFCSKNDKK